MNPQGSMARKLKTILSPVCPFDAGKVLWNIMAGTDHGCPDGVSCNTQSKVEPGKKWRGQESDAKRSEEHTSELQSRPHLVCRLLLEKKKKKISVYIKRVKM